MRFFKLALLLLPLLLLLLLFVPAYFKSAPDYQETLRKAAVWCGDTRRAERQIIIAGLRDLLTNPSLAETRQTHLYPVGPGASGNDTAVLLSNSLIPWPITELPEVRGWDICFQRPPSASIRIPPRVMAIALQDMEFDTDEDTPVSGYLRFCVCLSHGDHMLDWPAQYGFKPTSAQESVNYDAKLKNGTWIVELLPERQTGATHTPEQLTRTRQRRFAFRSLEMRLAYEGGQPQPATPKPMPEWTSGKNWWDDSPFAVRTPALALLHSLKAQEFMATEGMGVSRRVRPLVEALPVYPDWPIPMPPLSEVANRGALQPRLAGSLGSSLTPEDKDPFVKLNEDRINDFVGYDSYGYIESRSRVAGFEPHRFKDGRADYSYWIPSQLLLVSLLKFSQPAVYISQHMPNMKELTRVPTRPLDEFEQRSLKRLQSGEDVVYEGTQERVRMLGSLRAR